MMRLLAVLADAAPKLTAPEGPAIGSLTEQQIILDAAVFIIGVLVLGGLLAYIGKRIFTDAD
jgi:hypothetical protein